MHFYAFSDIHVDYPENLTWCKALGNEDHSKDTLILAGDATDNLELLSDILAHFARTWAHVFFLPEKLHQIEDLCTQLGVHTKPQCIDGVWVVPLHSWYHPSWDTQPDVPGAMQISKLMMDFHLCNWPEGLSGLDDTLALWMDRLNEKPVADVVAAVDREHLATGTRAPIITYSHFLPLQCLMPPKTSLLVPDLPKASGSNFLAARIEALRPQVHVFGHTHIAWDQVVDGVRYVQHSLDYPRSRSRWGYPLRTPLLVYKTEHAHDALQNVQKEATTASGGIAQTH